MMQISHTDTKILLVGRGLIRSDELIDGLTLSGAELHFASDADEGLRLIGLDCPDIVICHADLPQADASRLGSAISSYDELRHAPLLFAGESRNETETLLSQLRLLMERRSDEQARQAQIESMRRRHLQTLEMVRETSVVLRSVSNELPEEGSDAAQRDELLEMGLGLIAGLALVLEDQIKDADRCFGVGNEPVPAGSKHKTRFRTPISLQLPLAA